MPFDMTPVKKSSNVAAYGYDPTSNRLRVEFKNGRQYDYEGVSQKMADTLNEANEIGNVGSYVGSVIKPNRPVKEVDRVLPRPPQEEEDAK